MLRIYKIPIVSSLKVEPLNLMLQGTAAIVDCSTQNFTCGAIAGFQASCALGVNNMELIFFLPGQDSTRVPRASRFDESWPQATVPPLAATAQQLL